MFPRSHQRNIGHAYAYWILLVAVLVMAKKLSFSTSVLQGASAHWSQLADSSLWAEVKWIS